MKLYEEIKKAGSETEKVRRQFWNEKAKFLCTRFESAHLKKTELYGMIDVAWMLRKTALLKDDARKLQIEEKELIQIKQKCCLKEVIDKKVKPLIET